MKMTGYKRVGKGGFDHSNLSKTYLGGNNQKVWLITDPDSQYFGYVVKELKSKFHGESPHEDWDAERRANAAVEAYEKFPDLFPETIKTGTTTIVQKYVKPSSRGTTLGDALENGDSTTLYRIFRNMKRLHDGGYIHADVNEENVGSLISVDSETFGSGSRVHDLSKLMRIAHQKGRDEIVKDGIERLYGQSVVKQLSAA